MIVIIKHIAIEGPGTLEDFLKERKITYKIIELGQGEKLPRSLSKIRAVISLGGPMNVYEEEKHPFLKKENIFIKCILENEKPFLGICLGAQLLAKAAGAKVRKNHVKEIGWFKIKLTPEGERDLFCQGLSKELLVFQWHEDTFALPKQGTLLAEGTTCLNQAFKVGRNAYGIQFHIEVTSDMIESWLFAYNGCLDKNKLLNPPKQTSAKFLSQAYRIYENFSRLL
jgi:GMP synthase-like glutamine amidotransferase